MYMNRQNLIAIIFSAIYILICLLIGSMRFEGSWGGLIAMFLALPFSALSIIISNYIGGMPAFLIMNAVWWHFLVRLFFYIKLKSK
jgi:hypothetical protein